MGGGRGRKDKRREGEVNIRSSEFPRERRPRFGDWRSPQEPPFPAAPTSLLSAPHGAAPHAPTDSTDSPAPGNLNSPAALIGQDAPEGVGLSPRLHCPPGVAVVVCGRAGSQGNGRGGGGRASEPVPQSHAAARVTWPPPSPSPSSPRPGAATVSWRRKMAAR